MSDGESSSTSKPMASSGGSSSPALATELPRCSAAGSCCLSMARARDLLGAVPRPGGSWAVQLSGRCAWRNDGTSGDLLLVPSGSDDGRFRGLTGEPMHLF